MRLGKFELTESRRAYLKRQKTSNIRAAVTLHECIGTIKSSAENIKKKKKKMQMELKLQNLNPSLASFNFSKSFLLRISLL